MRQPPNAALNTMTLGKLEIRDEKCLNLVNHDERTLYCETIDLFEGQGNL
jgi:hypothetical protein